MSTIYISEDDFGQLRDILDFELSTRGLDKGIDPFTWNDAVDEVTESVKQWLHNLLVD